MSGDFRTGEDGEAAEAKDKKDVVNPSKFLLCVLGKKEVSPEKASHGAYIGCLLQMDRYSADKQEPNTSSSPASLM